MKTKKIRMIMAGIFCLGVLIGGLGTGIAFAEISDFAYCSVKTPQDAFRTKEFTCPIPTEEGEKLWVRRYFAGAMVKLTEKETTPEGKIEVAIAYNTENCSVDYTQYLDAEEEKHLQFYLDTGSDFEHFMKYKDDFLEGLRKKELRDYQIEYVQSVEICVNPKDREKISWD